MAKVIFSSFGFTYCRYLKLATTALKKDGNNNGFKIWSVKNYPIVPFKLADIGEGIKEVTIKRCHVRPQQRVNQFEDVCEVESDKASVNITSRFDGVVKKVHFNEGDVIAVGATLIDIEVDDGKETVVKFQETTRISEQVVEEVNARELDVNARETDVNVHEFVRTREEQLQDEKVLATPAVRRIAKEYNLDLKLIGGSGKDGRVLKEDILTYISQPSPTDPVVMDPAGETKTQLISGYRKVMFRTMTESNRIPTLTLSEEIDVTDIETIRKTTKKEAEPERAKITLLAFLVKAISLALHRYPVLNATMEGETIVYSSSHNIGIAIDTDFGLAVPNIKKVQTLSIRQIAEEIRRLQKSAAENKLSLNDTNNGSFTISNIGSIGGTVTKPLILPPQVAIVGIGRVRTVPRYNSDDTLCKRSVLNASWAADHRIVDGGTVARFSNLVKKYVEQPALMLVDI